MSDKSVANVPFPDVWGPGQLFAFSGLDGPTDYAHGLVGRTTHSPAGLSIQIPGRCLVVFDPHAPSRAAIAGDWFDLDVPAGRIHGAMLDAHHLLIHGPCHIASQSPAIHTVSRAGRTLIGSSARFDPTRLAADLDAAVAQRRAWCASRLLPPPASDAAARTMAKALSVMKTQVCTPEGRITRRWTTPDRWPHRDMWLWDSAFHAIGLRHLDPALARDALAAVLDVQNDDGMIAHQHSPLRSSVITQPPVLTLAACLIDRADPDPAWLESLYPKLCRYVQWDLDHRDSDGQGLAEWMIEGNVNCRSGESGMDNSTRFDSARQLDAVDFNAFLALETELLAVLARRLGRADDAQRWSDRQQTLCRLINQRLWSESRGLYMDCFADTGEPTSILSGAAFLPLLSAAPSPEQARRLATHLDNPDTFATAVPIASIAPGSPGYAKDMWRGPMWVNLNWLVALGLDRHGLHDHAQRLRRSTMHEIECWYLQLGSLYEYYDTQGQSPPTALLRKGKNADDHPHRVIHDYGWTATLYADLALGPGSWPVINA